MTRNIQGWTPKTNLLLLGGCCPSNSDDTSCEQNYHGGYDIIDHAFGYKFPTQLLSELQTNGWIDDTNGASKGRLKPARTKMDVDVDNLLLGFINPFTDNDAASTISKPSSTNDGSVGGGATRGDVSAFIPRHERTKDDFSARYPNLHKLVSSIEGTACNKYLGKSATKNINNNERETSEKKDTTCFFEFDTTLTSVQVAKYPGDGDAGYPRHCDRGAACLNAQSISTQHVQNGKDGTPPGRVLTFVYYLTPPDWDEELDGGALRMFSPKSNGDNGGTQNATTKEDAQYYFDATPYADRLVVFCSDVIEHQVMPSLRRDRIAVTVWLYGRVVHQGPAVEAKASLPPNNIDLASQKLGTDGDGKCSSSRSSLPPALPLSSGSVTEDKSIYVAIPSYRDEETWPTIKSLVETARHPQRVYIGVVFQVDTLSQDEVQRYTTASGSGISLEQFQRSQDTNVRSIILDCRNATGEFCYMQLSVV